jgi:hypothetical protein
MPSAYPDFEARLWYDGTRRRRVGDARGRVRTRDVAPARSRPDALHVPLFGRAMHKFLNVNPSNRR